MLRKILDFGIVLPHTMCDLYKNHTTGLGSHHACY
jgi:hypothetical protein